MSDELNTILGSLVPIGNIDSLCLTGKSASELIIAITKFLGIELPQTITNVYISTTQPSSTSRSGVWFKLNSAAQFVGIYVFSDGTYRQMFPNPSGIFSTYGNSNDYLNLPTNKTGYLLADENNNKLPPGVGTHLKTLWTLDSTGQFYIRFDTTFQGL